MRIVSLDAIKKSIREIELVDAMRDALIAQSRGDCDTPMPMHLDVPPEKAEVHIKASYRRGGDHFALKVASTFPGNLDRGLSVGNGMMLLMSAETGEPLSYFADGGYMTDMRTAAASAMVTRELGRKDTVLGVIGTGLQARYQAQLHAAVLDLERVVVWGRNSERVATYVDDMAELLPAVKVQAVASPGAVAESCRLIATCTASRGPLLAVEDVRPGTHIAAVGSDGAGKQELDPAILESASLLLVDSLSQCERLGELQHCPAAKEKAVEIGAFCASQSRIDAGGITVADFTGLGVEDLFISVYCHERSLRP